MENLLPIQSKSQFLTSTINPYSNQKKAFSLVSTMIGVLLLGLITSGIIYYQQQTTIRNTAIVAGEQIKIVGEGVNDYIKSNKAEIVKNCSANPCSISVNSLISQGYLFGLNDVNIWGNQYVIQVKALANGKPIGLVYTDSEPPQNPLKLLGFALQGAGANGGATNTNLTELNGLSGAWVLKSNSGFKLPDYYSLAYYVNNVAKIENTSSMLPGSIIAWASTTIPDGFLELNGQPFDKNENPELAILFPSGKLPDFRGYVLRGLDRGKGVDSEPTRVILSTQGDAIRNITGSFWVVGEWATPTYQTTEGVFNINQIIRNSLDTGGWGRDYRKINLDASKVVPTADENRMKNVAVIYIIKNG